MILGVGTDICNTERISDSLNKFGDKFINKICTNEEALEVLEKKDTKKTLAKYFAVKEATSKALGTGIGADVGWHDIELYHNSRGKPYIKLSQKAQKVIECKNFNIEVSISDDEPFAVAFVIIEGN